MALQKRSGKAKGQSVSRRSVSQYILVPCQVIDIYKQSRFRRQSVQRSPYEENEKIVGGSNEQVCNVSLSDFNLFPSPCTSVTLCSRAVERAEMSITRERQRERVKGRAEVSGGRKGKLTDLSDHPVSR